MDQVKEYLAVAMKHGFWIGAVIVLLASVGVWYTSTSKLASENASQTQKIESAIQTVSSVRGELDTLPNDHSHEAMKGLIDARRDQVLEAWQTLYDRQRDILTWPVQELKQDFVAEYEDKIPIETYFSFPTEEVDELETTLLNRYADYIKNVLPDIAKIAGAEWTAEFGRSAGMGMDMGGMGMGGMGGMDMMMGASMARDTVDITGAAKGPLVAWSSGSQSQLLGDLFPWRGQQPSTLEVYYSQENLWILKQLLQIIADVNGQARQPYQAKIHEIKRIGIGSSVSFGAGAISEPGALAAGGMEMGGMDMEDMMGMDMGGYDDMDGMGGDGMGSAVAIDPADNRYVNTSLEPITGTALRSALTSNSPSDAALAVAKRVPVMMSLNMDQRAVHELVAACGSAALMVEVHQVRVLPKTAGEGGMDMGGMGMEDESEMDMGMDMGGMGGMGGMSGMGSTTSPKKDAEFPLDMSVEIYGIISIFNPPDPVKLGVEQVTDDTVIDGATETIGGTPVAPATPATVESELPTPAPGTTAPAPGTTTPAPGTTTPAPGTTTPAPDATTPAPGSPTPATPDPAAATPPVAAGTPTPPPALLPTP